MLKLFLLLAALAVACTASPISVVSCVVGSMFKDPTTRHGAIYSAMMASSHDECVFLSVSVACGHLYATSVGMRERDFMCLFDCTGLFTRVCDDVMVFVETTCPPVDPAQCRLDLDAFGRASLE
jgi:hypothetical protein